MTKLDSNRSSGITAQLVGGLGNQLFIYACTRAVAARLQCPVFFDVSLLAQPVAGETPRALALDWILEPGQVLPVKRRSKLSRIGTIAARRIPLMRNSSLFVEDGFHYDSRIANVGVGTELRGYFQSWRYFDDLASELRTDLLRKAPTSNWSQDELHGLHALGSWIAVHVRRGDYALAVNADFHGLLAPAYYEQAVSTALAADPTATLVVFSDEPAYARDVLEGINSPKYFIEPPNDAHAMESIALMSNATSVVMANSSFSWWGAWLADPIRTSAIAPSPWFRSTSMSDVDLFPPQWIKVASHLR